MQTGREPALLVPVGHIPQDVSHVALGCSGDPHAVGATGGTFGGPQDPRSEWFLGQGRPPLLAQSLHALHEAGLWNALQETAWDTSGIVANSSAPGNVLRGLIAYQAKPSVGEAILYWAYLLPVATWFFFGDRISTWWARRRGAGSATPVDAPPAGATTSGVRGAVPAPAPAPTRPAPAPAAVE